MTLLKSGTPIDPGREYTVAGWASVNEGTEGPPVWDLVERYVSGRKSHCANFAAIACIKISGILAGFRMGDHDKKRQSRRGFLAGAAGIAAAGAGTRRQSAESAAQRPGLDQDARRRRRGARLWPAVEYEKHVIRRTVPWLTATPESSVSFTPLHALDGIITPNGLCFERHHSGIAEIDPADHRLMLHGLVDKPLIFTLADVSGCRASTTSIF